MGRNHQNQRRRTSGKGRACLGEPTGQRAQGNALRKCAAFLYNPSPDAWRVCSPGAQGSQGPRHGALYPRHENSPGTRISRSRHGRSALDLQTQYFTAPACRKQYGARTGNNVARPRMLRREDVQRSSPCESMLRKCTKYSAHDGRGHPTSLFAGGQTTRPKTSDFQSSSARPGPFLAPPGCRGAPA